MPPKTRSKKPEAQNIGDMFLALSESIGKQAREPNILAYKPHYKQQQFHMSDDKIRLYIGGNRSGKSFGAVAEDVWWCSHTHPYQKTPEGPVRGRVIAVDLMQGINQIILPLFSRLMTPSMLVNGSWDDSYSKSERILSFSNGSFIEFLSYEMETNKFAGTSRHFVHYDEEPPKHVYNESQARLIDTNGRAWLSMTPLLGLTWVHEQLYQPAVEAPDKDILVPGTPRTGEVFRSDKKRITVIEVSMNENPHLSAEAQDAYLETLDDPDEREARQKGHFITIGGKVFKSWDPATHVIPPILNPAETLAGWEWYSSTDHGWNNPTAWLWHAVSPQGQVITFMEHYQDHMTIADHAERVKAIEKGFGREPDLRVGDPAMKQENAITGTSIIQEYSLLDLFIAVESVPRSVDIGIGKMQQYFKVPDKGRPQWLITENCVNFINELKKLRWETYASKKQQFEKNKKETVQKKDDHAFDSARYFATFLPDLTPLEVPAMPAPTDKLRGGQVLLYDQALNEAHDNRVQGDNQMWSVLETYK